MTRPTAAALAFAKSTLPVRRVASPLTPTNKTPFASLLQRASGSGGRAASSSSTRQSPRIHALPSAAAGTNGIFHAAMLPGTAGAAALAARAGGPAPMVAGGPAPISRADILANADQLLGIPYVWGGDAGSGLDCSAFVSKAWGIPRHTTDNLSSVATPITRDELQAGDALNLTTSRDAGGAGHVRMFDRWANPEHTQMYVYEETPPRSIHHVINWDPKYQPMRRMNLTDA